MWTYVRPQQFFPRFVSQHAYHRVIHIDKSVRPAWQKTIPPECCRTAPGNFRSASRRSLISFRTWIVRAIFFRNAPRVREVETRKVRPRPMPPCILRSSLGFVAKRAGKCTARFRDVPQTLHRFSHQRYRWNPICVASDRFVRTIFQDSVVHHDVIADRVNILHPLPLRTLQLRKSPKFSMTTPHDSPALRSNFSSASAFPVSR